mgnify:CR=1 FL=1
MAPQFIKDFGFVKGIWYAVFHSISAFCNAGFDLMGVRETLFLSDPLCGPSGHQFCHYDADCSGRSGLSHMGGYMDQPAVLEKIQDAEQGDSHHNGSFDPDPGSEFFIFLNLTGLSGRDGARVSGLLYSSL